MTVLVVNKHKLNRTKTPDYSDYMSRYIHSELMHSWDKDALALSAGKLVDKFLEIDC